MEDEKQPQNVNNDDDILHGECVICQCDINIKEAIDLIDNARFTGSFDSIPTIFNGFFVCVFFRFVFNLFDATGNHVKTLMNFKH